MKKSDFSGLFWCFFKMSFLSVQSGLFEHLWFSKAYNYIYLNFKCPKSTVRAELLRQCKNQLFLHIILQCRYSKRAFENNIISNALLIILFIYNFTYFLDTFCSLFTNCMSFKYFKYPRLVKITVVSYSSPFIFVHVFFSIILYKLGILCSYNLL